MSIPSLKKVNIAKSKKTELYAQLDLVSFTGAPVAINIAHLEGQVDILKNIESYIEENEVRLIPYPVCVLCSEDIQSSSLLIIKNLRNSPNFFNQKIKTLNLKENALLKRINLLQSKLKNNNTPQSQRILRDFSSVTQEIDLLDRQSRFIKKIIKDEGHTNE
jgi:hypothetical protein